MERMKSLLGVLVAALLLVAGSGIAGAQPNLVIDRSHGQQVDLRGFTDHLTKDLGWKVTDLTKWPNPPAVPSDCSLLLVPQPTVEFSDAEVAAVHAYVEGGGGLWVLYDACDNCYGSPKYLNALPAKFGVTFNADTVWQITSDFFSTFTIPVPSDLQTGHPPFTGVADFVYYHGASLNADPSLVSVVVTAPDAYADSGVYTTTPPPVLATADVGTGHAVFIGDILPLEPSTYNSLDAQTKLLLDNIAAWLEKPEESGPIPVTINIRPWCKENRIDLQSRGVIRVAVLSTPEFDVKQVDPKTVLFAEAKPLCWMRIDVDRDRDKDLLFLFPIRNLKLTEESTEATLTGKTLDGKAFEGTDTVQMVQHKTCKKPEKPDNRGNHCEGNKR